MKEDFEYWMILEDLDVVLDNVEDVSGVLGDVKLCAQVTCRRYIQG